jgi:hypothetical protein
MTITSTTTTTKIALAAALVIGAASAALANDIETNPSTIQSVREWQEYQSQGQSQRHMGNAGTSYGYFGSPVQQNDLQLGKRSRSQ